MHSFVPSKQQERLRAPSSAAAQPVCCQKFFGTRHNSGYFAVDPVEGQKARPAGPVSRGSVADQVLRELAGFEAT